jgi:hypothetical protein
MISKEMTLQQQALRLIEVEKDQFLKIESWKFPT